MVLLQTYPESLLALFFCVFLFLDGENKLLSVFPKQSKKDGGVREKKDPHRNIPLTHPHSTDTETETKKLSSLCKT